MKSFKYRSRYMSAKKASKSGSAPAAPQSAAEDEYYELLPVEKKLIAYSLALGIGLLVVFIFAFGVFK
jgi:hypothetical protein